MQYLQLAVKVVFFGTLIALLQACTINDDPSGLNVASAYDTSGLLLLSPYTRSIINSNNF